jgi:hypothetical protein
LLAPLNGAVQALIHAIARGQTRPSLTLLRRLYDDTRADVYAATLAGFQASNRDRAVGS